VSAARALAVASALAIVVAGCGGGKKKSESGATTARAAPVSGPVAISTPPPRALGFWSPDSDNVAVVTGRVTAGSKPAPGVRLRVDRWELPRPTDANGAFSYPVDTTRLARHVVAVVEPAGERATAAITVAYPIHDVRAGRDARGNPTLSGRISFADGSPPPTAALYSYELTGTVTDAKGKPVVGARVSTRTLDRDFWTVSSPTDENGRYRSVFIASSELGGNPVPYSVRVAKGDRVYEFLPDENVNFQRLQSARMDVRLPPRGYAMALPKPTSYPGAVYEGVVVGAAADGRPVRPLAATWPDAGGRFTLTLPRELAGKTVTLWEAKLDLFSRAAARAGGPIDLRDWPPELAPDEPQDLLRVELPR
jgi:hypothetical protein